MALQLRMHLGSTKTLWRQLNRFPQMSVWSAFWGTNCGTDAVWIFAVQSLDRILHGGGKLAIGASELLEQHIAEARVRLVDTYGEHELLDMMIH